MHVHGEAYEVDAKFVDLAVAAQNSLGARRIIHDAIRDFVTATLPLRLMQSRDESLETITNLIHAVKFRPEEVNQNQANKYKLSMTSNY